MRKPQISKDKLLADPKVCFMNNDITYSTLSIFVESNCLVLFLGKQLSRGISQWN